MNRKSVFIAGSLLIAGLAVLGIATWQALPSPPVAAMPTAPGPAQSLGMVLESWAVPAVVPALMTSPGSKVMSADMYSRYS